MSKYSVNQTVLREEKYLVEALKEMSYEVEVHPDLPPIFQQVWSPTRLF